MSLKHQKPNEELMRDLLEVQAEAQNLRDQISLTASILPNEFPRGPLEDMLITLTELPNGTAAECRAILYASDKRLAKIRHKYFRHKQSSATPDIRTLPTERGQELDSATGKLRNAIGSALEECRDQEVEVTFADDFDPWDYKYYDNEPDAPDLEYTDVLDIEKASKELQTELDEGHEKISHIIKDNSVTGDNLKRVWQDTQNLNLMNRVELSLHNGTASIRGDLSHRMKVIIPVAHKMVGQISEGLDYVSSMHEEWEEFKKGKSGYILNKVKKFVEIIDTKLAEVDIFKTFNYFEESYGGVYVFGEADKPFAVFRNSTKKFKSPKFNVLDLNERLDIAQELRDQSMSELIIQKKGGANTEIVQKKA